MTSAPEPKPVPAEVLAVNQRLVRDRNEWRSIAHYALHLAMYGERAEGGDETWVQLEWRMRMQSSRESGKCMACGGPPPVDAQSRRCPACTR